YHLLDADWASNALSWQWVAGTNSNKKYIANQDNINKYCHTKQSNTFLDISYDDFDTLKIPEVLLEMDSCLLKTPMPEKESIKIDEKKPTYIYNFYNLDPLWDQEICANRILLLEPSHFNQYPISLNSMNFMLEFSKNNIDNIQLYVGEFNDFILDHAPSEVNYKEHPLNSHYSGIKVPRDFIFDVKGYYPSFFSYWKKCKKELIY
ncbi:FAD-binding domain-containing protein, partial [Flavobacteriaceae bacterium]|nr:FAD-binding domain-containing protein [Flavobacteriaceae bacterium]